MKKTYCVEGMTCSSCEALIGKTLLELDGVEKAEARLKDNRVEVEFDTEKVSEERIKDSLKKAGYPVCGSGKKNSRAMQILVLVGAITIFAGLYLAIEHFSGSSGINFTKLDGSTSYALLFGIGLVTGLHCIAMCGGFVLSYSTKQKTGDVTPHLSYGLGKLISYTAIGAFFGLLGSIIAFTIETRIAVALLAGLFLVAYGLGNLGLLPKVLTSRIKVPGPIASLRENLVSRGPFATGIATGFFVACGPLQAMYIMAAGSGSMAFGGLALFFFGLGTLPVMLGFSYVSSMISQAMATRITRYSGVLIVLLGLIMVNNALVLSGVQVVPSLKGEDATAQFQSSQLASGTALYSNLTLSDPLYQVIRMNVTRFGWEPDSFVLKRGVPVKWIIDGKEITSCNNEIIVRDYGLDIKVQKGEQTIEFTPTKAGVVSWSCWMGMIPGKFTVVEGNATQADAQKILSAQANVESASKNTGSSCGMNSGGSCGCGAKG